MRDWRPSWAFDWRHFGPGRYRWRTHLRGVLPWRPPLYLLAPKGRDCGNHEWYRQDDEKDACYHCRVTRLRDAS